jgi:hypothetical protein
MKAQILALNHRTFRLLQNRRAFLCRRPDACNPTLVGLKKNLPAEHPDYPAPTKQRHDHRFQDADERR